MGSSLVQTPYGAVSSRYKHARLADLCVEKSGVQTGPFGSQLHQRDYVSLGVPIITVEHLGENRILHQNLPRVSDEDRERLSRYSLKPGDIVFSRVGSVDLRALVREEESGWLFSGRCLRIRPEQKLIYPAWLSWFFGLPSFREHVRKIAVGATMPSLNTKILSDLPIFFPPLHEQKAIAHILGALDDKIELNRRMNETLEAMAWAVFKSWFVDFEAIPGHGPHKEWDDSPLGRIPKGWRVCGLNEVADYLNGLALQKFPPEGDDALPVIKIAQLRAGHTRGADQASISISPEYIVEDGDVLFSWSGSLEVEIWCGGRGALNQHLFKVTSKHFPKWFYFLWTRHFLPNFQDIAADKATTMGHIQRRHLSEAKVTIPQPKLFEAMNPYFTPLFEKIIVNRIESHTLAAIRDALLPKLLSGEIRVKDAERFAS